MIQITPRRQKTIIKLMMWSNQIYLANLLQYRPELQQELLLA